MKSLWYLVWVILDPPFALTWRLPDISERALLSQPLARAALTAEAWRNLHPGLHVVLFGSPHRDSERSLVRWAERGINSKPRDFLMFNVTAQRQRASTDATHFALGFATAVRDHLVATRAARASCSTHSSAGLVVVVAGAEQVPAEGLEMVMRPLHAAAEGTTVGVGSFDDGSQDSRGGASHVLGHILGTEVLLPPATTVVLLFHVPDVSFSAYQGRSGGGSGGGSGDAGGGGGDLDLVAAQEELRRALAPSVRRVLFRHSSVTLVPLVEQAPQWEASAVDCLRARQHQSHHNQHPLPPPPQQQQRPAHGGAHQHASLSRRFSGQPHAVEAVVRALSARDDGYDDGLAVNGADGSPLVLALLGPSGTGKTEFARELASSLHGGASAESLEASGHLVRFAMNQYTTQASLTNLLGADKGNVGQCQGALTNALRRKVQPHEDGGQGQGQGSIVVVLDEFEKAHASFADACFLNAFGAHGFLTDSCADNERVSTARATFIITSNFAAEELLLPDHALQLNPNQEDGGASTKGANSNSSLQKMKMKTKAAAYDAAVREATQRATSARESWQQDPQGRRNPFFRAEARGRVDAFVPFFPLTLEQRRVVAFSLLHKALATVELRFNQRHNSDNSDNSDNNNNNNNRSSGGGDSSGSGSGSEAGKGSNSLSVAPKLRLAWTPAVTSRLAGQYSSLEGLRPMVTALTELSAVLRKERERGRFDPSASGKVVALIDVDEDDEDDGEDDNDDGGGGVDGDGDDGDDGQRGGGRDGGGDGGRGQSGGYLGGVGKLVVRSLALSPEAFREVGFLEARGRGEEEEAAGTEPHIGGGVTREEEEEEEEEEENGKQQDFMALSHPPRHHEQQQEQQQQQWQEQEHTRSQLEETNHDDEDAATVSASSIHQDAETSTHRDKNEQVDSDQARAAVAAAVLVLRVAAFAALLLLSLFAAKALLSVLCAQAAVAAWVALAASGAMLAAACAVLSWAWFRFVPRWARDLAWGAAVKGFAFAWARPGTAGLFVGSALFFLPPLWGRFFWPHFTRFFLHPSSSSSSSSSRTRTQEGEEEEEEKKDSTRISNNSSRSSIDSSNSRLQRQNALLALTLKERDEAKQRVLQVEKLLSSAESRCSALTSELAELKKEKRRTPLGSGQQSSFLPTCLGGEEEGSGKLEESAQEENGDVRNEL